MVTGSLKVQLRMPRPRPLTSPARDPEVLPKFPSSGKRKVPTVARPPALAGLKATEVTFALHPHPGSCLQEMPKPFLKVKASLTLRQLARYVAKKVPAAPGLEEGGLQLCAVVGGEALSEDLTLHELPWPDPPAGGPLPAGP